MESIFSCDRLPSRAGLLLAQRHRADHAHRGDIDPELGGRHDGGRFTYSYDGAGNVTKELEITGQITTYAWDAENRMTRWEQAGTTHAIKYTGDGKRIELIRTPGIDTRYVWDGENIQNETNLAGLNRDVFTYEPAGYGKLLSVVLQGGTERFLVFDALGSADRLLATNQGVTDQYLYEAFGKEVLKTGTTRNPFRWLGQIGYYTDNETAGVPVYVRARQYSPVQGRWLSVDPETTLAILHAYLAFENSPLLFFDPSGLACTPWVKTIVPCTAKDQAVCDAWCKATGKGGGKNTVWYNLTRTCTFCFGLISRFESHRGGDCLCAPKPPVNKKQPGCPNPCPPPIVYIDLVPPSPPHPPCAGNHWHYVAYNQTPPPACQCIPGKRTFGGCL